jgi:NAD(P)-dependent dehydrogenase (short-subunit alcohol dehydrogenase family)
MTDSRIWLITGASRGLGRALAEAVLAHGDRVVATARDTKQLAPLVEQYGANVLPLALDVQEAAQATSVVEEAAKHFGRIDVLVNNAGYGFIGAFEEMTAAQFKGQIDTNFYGVVNVTRAVLPIMRQQGSGRILQVTSIGGRAGGPGLSAYHAAKFAVEGFSEALAQEVAPLGIQVCLVEPGGFRTDWGTASMDYAPAMEAYSETVGRRRAFMQSGYVFPGDPQKAAKAILELVAMKQMPLRQPLGTDASVYLKYAYEQALDELARTTPLAMTTDHDDADPSATHGILDRLKSLGRR